MGKRNATRMAPRVAVCAVAAAAVAYGGFCDESAEFSVEWRDEFEGDALNRSLWSVVCSNMSAPGCDDLPFITQVVLAEITGNLIDNGPPARVPFFQNTTEEGHIFYIDENSN